MKIAFVSIFPPHRDGIADYSFFLVEAMREVCSDCFFYIIAPTLDHNIEGIRLNEQVHLLRIWNMSSFKRALRSIISIIKIVVATKVDVLHIQYRFTREQGGSVGEPFLVLILILRKAMKRVRIVVSLHDFWLPSQVEKRAHEITKSRTLARLYRIYYIAYVRLMLSAPNLIFSIVNVRGSLTTELIKKYAKSEVVETLHGLPDIGSIDMDKRTKYKGIVGGDGKFTILLFGFIRKDKGYEYVLRAIRKIIESSPSMKETIRVMLVGAPIFPEDKVYLGYLEKLVDDLDLRSITLVIPKYLENEEVNSFFGAADVTIISNTRRVGPSGVFSLALAYEVPSIITSDGIYITHESRIPALIVNLNTDEIASAILGLMTNKHEYAQQLQKIRDYKAANSNQEIAFSHLRWYRKLLET